jgi:hypothetical protein
MINRGKKLRLIQFTLLIVGIIIVLFTYLGNNQSAKKNLLKIQKKKIESNQKDGSLNNANIFYNIEYAGFDLSGNRYVIRSQKAETNQANQNEIYMTGVKAIFYFKNNKNLIIDSNSCIYNNKTLDMIFKENIKASFDKSVLYANSAEYSNLKGLVTISDKVKIIDYRGNLNADKLLFDLKTQTLNIASNNKKNINAKIKK